MSKNIVIQESGIEKNLAVDALNLNKYGGSSEDWVPADDKNLVELQIGGSGTYNASSYGAYGIAVAKVKPKYGGGATSKAVEHNFHTKHIPVIKEGGRSFNFSAKLLKVNKQGAGTCEFVPESEVELEAKYITKSGTYKAEDDDCFGYSQVTVSGVDVTIDEDDDGDDVAHITDGDDTEDVVLPDHISVVTPPNITTYFEGATIDFTGMVVKAYLKRGGLWTDATHPDGVISISELTLPITTAHADSGTSATSDLDTGAFTQPIPLTGVITFAGTYRGGYHPYRFTTTWTPIGNAVLVVMKNTARQTKILYATKEEGDALLVKDVSIDLETSEQSTQFSTYGTNLSYTKDNKTAYYSTLTAGHVGNYEDMVITPSVDNYGSDADLANAAWTAVWGEVSGGDQNIPVQWNRPVDDEMLSDSFEITVN